MRFVDDELERYARQIVLPEIGGVGQARLRDASVLVVGAGGLGAPATLYLAAAGVGRIVLADDDRVSLGNLHRQVLYVTADVGRLKVEAATARLGALNPACRIDGRVVRLDRHSAPALCREVDIVIDGSDSFTTRSDVAAAAAAERRPLVSGSVQGFEGQLTLFAPYEAPGAPCFACLFAETPPSEALPTCAMGGVLGAVAGQVGSMMATEALKRLLGLKPSLVGTLLLIDGLGARIDRIKLEARAGCPGPCTPHSAANPQKSSLAPVASDL